MSRNIRMTLAYDGSHYVGWQVQPNGPSVQAAVERSLSKLTGEPVTVFAAGRTDAGVHALGQVISFRTTTMIPGDRFAPALQQFLPDDVVARDSAEVVSGFHATFSASRKRYRYIIHNVRRGSPFVRRFAYRYPHELNLPAMQEAANSLLGTHDFRSFETQFPNKATSVRTIHECRLGRASGWAMWESFGLPPSAAAGAVDAAPPDAARQDFIWLDIVADGFLYNMVRTIMGTLIRVGRGFWQPADVRRIIDAQNRGEAGDTAPAHGLHLVQVDYPPELYAPIATV